MIRSVWPTRMLGELTEPDRPITYGVVKPGDHDNCNGILFIRGGDILNGRINISGLRTITTEVSSQYKRTILKGGELLVSLVGMYLGEVAIAPLSLRDANLARQVGLVALRREVHAHYVMYFLISDFGRREFIKQTTGACQPVINLADLKNVNVPLPTYATQRKIASILSAYDDLIENNSRRIAILEAMAQVIYREWFVEFRFPGHDKVKLVDSPLGKIPEGWKATVWGELASLEYGKALRGYEDSDKSYPVFGTNGPIGWHEKPLCETPGIIIGRKGAYRGIHYSDVPFWVIDTAFFLKPKSNALDILWAFYQLLNVDINSMDSGSAIPSTSRDAFYAIPVVSPTSDVTKSFQRIVDGLLSQCAVLKKQNDILRTTRDLLLPKLISGQLDVEDLDIEAEEPLAEAEK